jgi:GTP-binding protein LepA
LERERGITIKVTPFRWSTPTRVRIHLEFNWHSGRWFFVWSFSIYCGLRRCAFDCDAAQSIQAQTISNLYLALENDLEIIPVLNKVGLPSATLKR